MVRYNTLIMESYCPNCHEKTTLKIQFQYGEVWDYIYFFGDEIKWGSEESETKGKKLIVLDGYAETCEACDESADYLIFIENNIIKSARQNHGEYQFFGTEGFIVLEGGENGEN